MNRNPDREVSPAEEEAEAPLATYRVAGDVQVKAAELELRVAELERTLKAAEHEMYATRKTLRARAAIRNTSIAGLGALIGVLVGSVLYAFTDQPYAIAVTTLIGFVLGYVSGHRSYPPDDFPPAPPARMY